MKNILLIIIAILGLLSIDNIVQAQVPNWTWAKQIADTSSELGTGIATDSLGNVYSVGYFQSPSLTVGATTLTNSASGTSDLYITKYNSVGNIIWAKSIGGSGEEDSKSIATDKSGNVYVAGYFASPTLNVGSTTFTNTSGSGGNDLFIIKYDPNGNVIWAKSANATGIAEAWGLCIDGSGNALITGRWAGPSLTIGSTTLIPVGTGFNIFVAKFDSNGNALWAKTSGGTPGSTFLGPSTVANGISNDGSGNVYISGYTSDSTYTFGTTSMTTNGSVNGLLLKYSASGTPLWAVNMTNGGWANFPTAVTADAAGNSVITGYAFGSTFTIGSTTLTATGTADIFLVKFDATGNVVWAKSIGGNGGDDARSVSSDASGNIYFTGEFSSPSITFGSITLTKMGSQDIFVAKYDASGNALWAKSAYGKDAYGNGVCVDNGGEVYVSGFYKDSTITFGSTILNNAGNYDAFVAKLSGTTSGIKENSLTNSASIYPNPFETETTIKLDKNIHDAAIKVYNANGQIVKEITDFNGTDYVLSREDLSVGMYFLQIVSKEEIIAPIKIIVN